jgi:hypothetical protein
VSQAGVFVTAQKQTSADMLNAIQQNRSMKALPQSCMVRQKPGIVQTRKGESLLRDLDVIDEVGGLSEASGGEVTKLFVVQD